MRELARTAAVRAIKTFAQTLGALLTAAGTGLLETDWLTSLSVAGMAALLSVLTTVGGQYVPERNEGGAVGLEFIVGVLVGITICIVLPHLTR